MFTRRKSSDMIKPSDMLWVNRSPVVPPRSSAGERFFRALMGTDRGLSPFRSMTLGFFKSQVKPVV